ncbi:hypothetical protein [Loktanella sp. R86503]|uniref:hypothetical protein n=1 Tax=Loktanella sp. R86503 TaxID=3093847 RepID=UPI0036DC7CB3
MIYRSNECYNLIKVDGTPARIRAFKDAVSKSDSEFSFCKILPIPTLLHNIYQYTNAYHFAGKVTNETHRFVTLNKRGAIDSIRNLTPKEMAKLETITPKFGPDWCVENWGCNAEAIDIDLQDYEHQLAYDFITPHSPPRGIIKALRAKFPDLHISAFFDNDQDEIAGYY